jgi:hypothetical protein
MALLEKENKELREMVQNGKQNYELLYSSITNLNTAVSLLINQHRAPPPVHTLSVYGGADEQSKERGAPAESGVNSALDQVKASSVDNDMIFRRRSVV